MMAILGRTSSCYQVLAERRYFFMRQFEPVCCTPILKQKIILEIKTQGGGGKKAGEDTKITRGDNQQLKWSLFSFTIVVIGIILDVSAFSLSYLGSHHLMRPCFVPALLSLWKEAYSPPSVLLLSTAGACLCLLSCASSAQN